MIEENFLKLVSALKKHITGWERSIKITSSSYDSGRFLCGVNKTAVALDDFLIYLADLHPPQECVDWLIQHWDSSNFLYLAIEGADTHKLMSNDAILKNPSINPVVKVYLEFPVLISTQINGQVDKGEKALWCKGYKWSPETGSFRVTNYHLHPMIELKQSCNLMHNRAIDLSAKRSLMQLLDKVELYQISLQSESIEVLEVETDSTNWGLDFRLYALNLSISAFWEVLENFLHQNHIRRSIDQGIQGFFRGNQSTVGHISVGYDQHCKHVTVYYEIAGLS